LLHLSAANKFTRVLRRTRCHYPRHELNGNVTTDVTLSGSVAQYGRASGIIQGVANQLLGQFSQNLKRSLDVQPEESGKINKPRPESQNLTQATQSATPISGVALIARVVWSAFTGWFRRKARSGGGPTVH
jgi:hypothetical protein